jgi:S1-C subfamily serine protease
LTRLARKLLLVALTAVALVATPIPGAAPTALTTGVVEIQTRYASNGGGAATGFVLTSTGRVLTNNHVIRGAARIRVTVPEGRTYTAQVLGYSLGADVALLQLRGAAGLDTVVLGNSASVEVGDEVTAVGNAGGTGTLTIKEGRIVDRGVTIPLSDGQGGRTRLTRLLETSADLRQGDSGGPLLDEAGRVIGMNAAASVSSSGDSDGYAIPINRATAIVQQIDTGRTTTTIHVGATPFLGVVPGSPETFGDSAARGVPIAGVRAGSPAARAGLERGDVIVSLNGNPVRTSAELVARLLRWHPGDTITVEWVDAFADRTSARVTLATGPPQ